MGRRARHRDDGDAPRKSARDKIMDYLARRSHSELELRQKLSRDYAPQDVDDAIEHARSSGWMTAPEELSERVSIELGRKRKGHRFINQFLKAKGLPPVAKDSDEELRKCLAVLEVKLAKFRAIDYDDQRKLHRWLCTRGFDDQTVRTALKMKLKSIALSETADSEMDAEES